MMLPDEIRASLSRNATTALEAHARATKAISEAMAVRRIADANSDAIRESADRCAESFGAVAKELGEVRETLQTILELLMRERSAESR